jgi:hypothetical protein
MRLLSLLLVAVHALCVIAAPMDFELHSVLAIPVPGSATYDADLAAAVAYARSHTSSSVQTSAIGLYDRYCGRYYTEPESRPYYTDLRGLATYTCINVKSGYVMEQTSNVHCGLCMYFDGK